MYWEIILHLPRFTVSYTTAHYKPTSTHQELTIFDPGYFWRIHFDLHLVMDVEMIMVGYRIGRMGRLCIIILRLRLHSAVNFIIIN